MRHFTRRDTLRLAVAGAATAVGCTSDSPPPEAAPEEPSAAAGIVDIHQHTPYSGRPPEVLLPHQLGLGVSRTVLLPAGRRLGLAANAGGNDVVWALRDEHPGHFTCFANELPDIPETRAVLEEFLNKGAIGIGEQKFPVDCDSEHIVKVAEIAKEFDVPVLLHFEHEKYNFHIERFHKILERFPTVNFIGHAQTFWGNIDAEHEQEVMYPKGAVTPGGITDKYLSDYPNMFGDLSAGSGRNSMERDEDHARDFLARHQDKLMFGSDCSDSEAGSEKCIGSQTLPMLRRLVADKAALDKILGGNARRIMRL